MASDLLIGGCSCVFGQYRQAEPDQGYPQPVPNPCQIRRCPSLVAVARGCLPHQSCLVEMGEQPGRFRQQPVQLDGQTCSDGALQQVGAHGCEDPLALGAVRYGHQATQGPDRQLQHPYGSTRALVGAPASRSLTVSRRTVWNCPPGAGSTTARDSDSLVRSSTPYRMPSRYAGQVPDPLRRDEQSLSLHFPSRSRPCSARRRSAVIPPSSVHVTVAGDAAAAGGRRRPSGWPGCRRPWTISISTRSPSAPPPSGMRPSFLTSTWIS